MVLGWTMVQKHAYIHRPGLKRFPEGDIPYHPNPPEGGRCAFISDA